MAQAFYHNYIHQSLATLAKLLLKNYHEPIVAICDSFSNTIPTIADKGYINAYLAFKRQLTHYINFREESLILYTKELEEKHLSGHDCRTCNHKCDAQHSLMIKDLQLLANSIKQKLLAVHIAAAKMPAAIRNDDVYLKHRYYTLLLDKTLAELFFLEDTILIPKMVNAQKSIYANH